MDPAAISCLCGPSCWIHKLDSLTKTIWSEDRPAAGQQVRNHSGKRACRGRTCVSTEPKRKKSRRQETNPPRCAFIRSSARSRLLHRRVAAECRRGNTLRNKPCRENISTSLGIWSSCAERSPALSTLTEECFTTPSFSFFKRKKKTPCKTVSLLKNVATRKGFARTDG